MQIFRREGRKKFMSLYAVVRNSTYQSHSDMILFYSESLNEVKGYANLIEKNSKGSYFWEVYELPSDFVKPTLNELKAQLRADIYRSPIIEMVAVIKENAIGRITRE